MTSRRSICHHVGARRSHHEHRGERKARFVVLLDHVVDDHHVSRPMRRFVARVERRIDGEAMSVASAKARHRGASRRAPTRARRFQPPRG